MRKKRFNINSRGVALVMLLFVMIILFIVSISVANLAITDSQVAIKHYYNKATFNLARSGITRARAELMSNQFWGGGTFTMDGPDFTGEYTVTVEITQLPEGKTVWKAISTGRIGQYSRTLEAWLRPEAFSEFMYVTHEDVGSGGQEIWFTSDDLLDGPMHTNGYFHIYGNPRYTGKVTSTNSYLNQSSPDDPARDPYAYPPNPSDPDFPGVAVYIQGGNKTDDTTRFYHYYNNYTRDQPTAAINPDTGAPYESFSFEGGRSAKEFPEGSEDIRDYALNQDNIDGIPIVGDAEIQFGYDPDFNQYTIEIETDERQPTNYYSKYAAYNLTPVQNRRKITLPASGPTAQNISSWTIYIDGTVDDIRGEFNGKATIAAEEDLKIGDDITYRDENDNILGLIAMDDIIVNTASDRRNDITIQAAMIAVDGSFTVDDYSRGIPRGKLTVFGSISQRNRGPVGTFNARTGASSTGYQKDYHFDYRLEELVPPNYPHTGLIVVKAFRDKGALGGD